MSKIVHEPHVLMKCVDGKEHVFPLEMVDRLIDGKVPLSEPDVEVVVLSIIKEWREKFLFPTHPSDSVPMMPMDGG